MPCLVLSTGLDSVQCPCLNFKHGRTGQLLTQVTAGCKEQKVIRSTSEGVVIHLTKRPGQSALKQPPGAREYKTRQQYLYCQHQKLRRGPCLIYNKLASLGATLVRNSADWLTDLLTGVKCRATSVAKNPGTMNFFIQGCENSNSIWQHLKTKCEVPLLIFTQIPSDKTWNENNEKSRVVQSASTACGWC